MSSTCHSLRAQLRSRTRLSVAIAAAVVAAVFVPQASATPPMIVEASSSDTFTQDGLCSFPVQITNHLDVRETYFFDRNGALTRIHVHVVEHDTFSANGTLDSLPYTFNLNILFEDGAVAHVFASGVVMRIPLADGSLFLSAGRLDFAVNPNGGFRMTPDVGVSGDMAAFCAALA